MSALEVVAKPVFAKSETEWLANLRKTLAYSAGSPEFTLVFPGSQSPTREIVQHIEAVCAVTPRIQFCLRSAMIVPDMQMSWFHVFLVPDEGFGAIIRLHDRLHVGPLAEALRRDEPYIPHLTVASVKEFDAARHVKASLNGNDLEIAGHIDELEVHERDGAAPRCVARIALAHRGLFG
jgi:2'-5' RNA ligase